jgi:hypothetical protein
MGQKNRAICIAQGTFWQQIPQYYCARHIGNW